jgi:hypothetical protein
LDARHNFACQTLKPRMKLFFGVNGRLYSKAKTTHGRKSGDFFVSQVGLFYCTEGFFFCFYRQVLLLPLNKGGPHILFYFILFFLFFSFDLVPFNACGFLRGVTPLDERMNYRNRGEHAQLVYHITLHRPSRPIGNALILGWWVSLHSHLGALILL